jgi:hypothetical protein
MKFYVRSKDLKVVIGGNHIKSHREAAKEALLQFFTSHISIAPLIIVSEKGFDYHAHNEEEDSVFDTMTILREAGFTIEDDGYG